MERGAAAKFMVMAALSGMVGCESKVATAVRPPAHIWEEFSGEKALEHVRRLLDLGPRPPGSTALEKSREYITAQLESSGWKVTRQAFEDDTPVGKVHFVNLVATFASRKTSGDPLFLVCSHYDTKTFETVEFVGANDGGSSTGALLELARVLSRNPALAARIELVCFDGEEAYESFTETDGLYGSRYFTRQLVAENKTRSFRGGILWDMIGDRDLTITLPPDSPSQLADGIFAAAQALDLRKHFTYFRGGITDDHTPLNSAGIPTIDLIDFDYPPWHSAGDTIDKLSAASLQIVGRVTAFYLSELAFK